MIQTHSLHRKCATYQPCDLAEKCALRALPESQVKVHFYPSDVGDNCHHYVPVFKPWGQGPDGSDE